MLITLFTILLLGGSSTTGLLDFIGDARDETKVVVADDGRRAEALGTFKTIKKITESRNKQVKNSAKELSTVLASPDLYDADIDKVWFVYFETVENYTAEMLDLRYELQEQITREEWEQIFPAE